MRALALAMALALLLPGCMNRPARKDRSGEVSYNRRDLPPEQGLFTGPDGVWTPYRNDVDPPPDEETPTRRRTILPAEGADPPVEEPREDPPAERL